MVKPTDENKRKSLSAIVLGGAVMFGLADYLYNLTKPQAIVTETITKSLLETLTKTVEVPKTVEATQTVTTTVPKNYGKDVLDIGRDKYFYWYAEGNNKIIFFLGGGDYDKDSYDKLWINGHEEESFREAREILFRKFNDNGYDVITNKSKLTFTGNEKYAKEAYDWCDEKLIPETSSLQYEKRKFAIGYSAGAMYFGRYITTDENGYDAAILINGLVDHNVPYPVKLSGHRADLVKIPVYFIIGGEDPDKAFIEEPKTYFRGLNPEIRYRSRLDELHFGHVMWVDGVPDLILEKSLGFFSYI